MAQHAPLYLYEGGVLGLELFDKELGGYLRLDKVPAGEDVYCGVAVLRPGVNGKVGFGNDNHAADAKGAEFMENDLNNRRLCLQSGIFHCISYKL